MAITRRRIELEWRTVSMRTRSATVLGMSITGAMQTRRNDEER
jgi:hypothetical protein